MLRFATKLAPQAPLLQQAIISGFRNTEIWLSDELLDDVDAIITTAQKFHMGYVPHFPNGGRITEQRLQQIVRLYQALECETMVIHEPMFDLYGDRMLEIEPGLSFAVENIRYNLDEFWQWAESHAGLNLDVEHLWLFSLPGASFELWLETLEAFLHRFHYKLHHVHMPGYQPGQPEHRPAYMNPRMACEVWTLLAEYQFQGLAVSELSPEWQTPKHLRQDVAMFEQWCFDPAGTLDLLRDEPRLGDLRVLAA